MTASPTRLSSGAPRTPPVPPLVKLRGYVTATLTLSFIIAAAAVGARATVAAADASQRYAVSSRL